MTEEEKILEILAQTYQRGYENGKKAAQPCWIPVTERLPENKGNVLIFIRNRDVRYGYWDGEKFKLFEHTHFPTHWLPLPEPPEGTDAM